MLIKINANSKLTVFDKVFIININITSLTIIFLCDFYRIYILFNKVK